MAEAHGRLVPARDHGEALLSRGERVASPVELSASPGQLLASQSPRSGWMSSTMQRQVAFWVCLAVALGLGLYLLADILLPFVAGAAIAYLLDPFAGRLQRAGFGRLGGTIVILSIFVLLLLVAIALLVPFAFQQIVSFAEALPGYVAKLQALVFERGAPLIERFGGQDALNHVQQSIGDFVGQGATWLVTFLKSLWTGGKAVVGLASILLVTPVVAFYLLVDWDRMVATLDSWVPPRHRTTVRHLGREMDRAVAGFVRGQSAVCLLLGSFYAIGLTMVGLNFGVLIGMLSGLLSFIPYVGSMTGLLLAVGVALVQFLPDWTWVAATLAVFLVGQFIEGNILSPKLVGASVGLHPVWLMFALLAFGSLFGFVGLLVAVPLAAMIGVLARFALRQYRDSDVFLGSDEEEATVPSVAVATVPAVSSPALSEVQTRLPRERQA